MATLMRIVGTLLAIAAGILMYDLAVRDALVMQFGPLLLILVAQFIAGWLLGLLMHSWRTLIAAPFAFVVGFIAAAPLREAGYSTPLAPASNAAQVAGLAGGSQVFAMVFLLTLLCSLLELGVALGTTRGVRLERVNAWRHAQKRSALLKTQTGLASAHGAGARPREVATVGR